MINTRREFMRNSVVAGTWATAGGVSTMPTLANAACDVEIYDVVVVGAGTAGAIAAIQAARLGLRTLLVEKNGMPGGTTTVAAVNFPGLFHAWGRQIIAGVGWELVTRTAALCGDALPDFSQVPERHWQHQVRVNRAIYTALLCEELQRASTEVLFHAMPAQVEEREEDVLATLCTKTGLESVRTRILIDASGDASAIGLAGYPLIAHEVRQPGTLIVELTGYDFDVLDQAALHQAFDAAVAQGELNEEDRVFVRNNIVGFLRTRGDNCTHIANVDGRTSAGRSAAELRSRTSLLKAYRFLRRQPGLEQLQIAFMAAECGIRETVTIQGEAVVSYDDYVSGRLWEDAVCYSFYPIDLHHAQGGGIDTRPLTPGTFPTAPRGALIPTGSKRLLAAGRCLSSDREANSALRVQATCMACGQAAAVIAARAIAEKVAPAETNMDAVRDLLRQHQAIVPDAAGPQLSEQA